MLRKKTKNIVFVLILFFGCALVADSVYAQGQGAKRGLGKGPLKYVMKLVNELELTEEQMTDLDAIKRDIRTKMEPLREELKGLEVLETVFAADLNEAAAETALAKVGELKAQMDSIKAEALLAVARVLTAEQRIRVLVGIEEAQQQRRDRRGQREFGKGHKRR
ncbi:MAG: periplasmic heavy metal sensor [Deltaproteobacteria bacterium]|nr:periplasmic heavy metal sensor [Deltaproteobacteria bacterium]